MFPLVEKTAKSVGEYSYCRKWAGGVFTDADNLYFKSVRLPDLVIFLNTLNPFARQHPAVRNAAKMLIPSVGIVDTNVDPRLITYPIPGNDDSPITVRLWCALFAHAIRCGKTRLDQDLERERNHYTDTAE